MNQSILLTSLMSILISAGILTGWYFGIVGIVTTGIKFIGIEGIPMRKIFFYTTMLLAGGGVVLSILMMTFPIVRDPFYRLAFYEAYGLLFSYLMYRFYFGLESQRVWQLLFFQFAIMIVVSSSIQFLGSR